MEMSWEAPKVDLGRSDNDLEQVTASSRGKIDRMGRISCLWGADNEM